MTDMNVTVRSGLVTVTVVVADQGLGPTRAELRQSRESFEAYVELVQDRVLSTAQSLSDAIATALANPEVTLLRLGEVNKAIFSANISFDRSKFPPNPTD